MAEHSSNLNISYGPQTISCNHETKEIFVHEEHLGEICSMPALLLVDLVLD